jgi:hypothetical protein
MVLVFQPSYVLLERVFMFFLAALSISFLGSALWVGPSLSGIVHGLFRFEMPDQHGRYNPLLVAVAMVGAVGGSLMNLAYPYFLEAKGWRGPQYRKVQFYDFLLAVTAMIVLNLAVWVLGAELLYPDQHIQSLDDLPRLLSGVLGNGGRWLFYAGIFAAIYTSVLGHAAGLAYMGTHAWLRWRAGTGPITSDLKGPSALPLDRGLVPRLSAHLDDPRHAGLRDLDPRRQQRPGRAGAAARGRDLVAHGQPALHRTPVLQPLVGRTR